MTSAVRAQVDAENAQADAEAAEKKAVEYGQNSMDAAGAELLIEGTVKTVGGTSLDATAGSNVRTTGEGATAQTTRTGLQAKAGQPMTMGEGSDAVPGTSADPEASPAVAYVAPVAAAVDRPLTIGKLVDSDDDTARLMIITQYAGTKTVKVYADVNTPADLTGPGDGTIQTVGADDNDPATNVFADLKSAGSYYLAGDSDGLSAADDAVAVAAEAADVYSYPTEGEDNTLGTADDQKNYVIVDFTTIDGATTTVTYQHVEIHVGTLDRDGDGAMDDIEVTAKIPEATDYEHIHFGVWAALGEAAANGNQTPSSLGIGFVQNFSGEGMTGADMPNHGGATYDGNWVAAVQGADDDGNGAVTLNHGDAMLTANFEKARSPLT